VGCSAAAAGGRRCAPGSDATGACPRQSAARSATVGARGGERGLNWACGWPETKARRGSSALAPADGTVSRWGPACRGRSSGRF
jgi:hypothetical protein